MSISSAWKGLKSQVQGDLNSFGSGTKNQFNQKISDGLEDLLHGVIGSRISQIPRIDGQVFEAKKVSRENRIREDLRSNKRLLESPLEQKVLVFPETYFGEDNNAVSSYRGKRHGMLSEGKADNGSDIIGGRIAAAVSNINEENSQRNKEMDRSESYGDFPNSIHFRSLPRISQDFREYALSDKRYKAGKYMARDAGLHGSINIGEVNFTPGGELDDTDETLYDIFLYLPHNLNDSIKVNYTEGEAGMFETFIARLFPGDMTEVAGERNIDMQEIWGAFKSMVPGSSLASQASGNMMNPMKYQALEGIGFRSYSYKFTLRPNNGKEANTIKEIMRVFKASSIPGAAGENFRIWTLPNEWSIRFQGPIKDWIDFPLASVCTGISVDYGGGGAVTLMEDGAPAAIDLTLEFMETVQLNRQKYLQEVAPSSKLAGFDATRKEGANEGGMRFGLSQMHGNKTGGDS
jgi:hypothetical protein